MIKKVFAVVLAILLVFALAAGAGYSLAVYRSGHIFIQGDAYPLRATAIDLSEKTLTIEEFEAIQAQIPQCKITWMVPFQGGSYSSASTSLTVTSITRQDLDLIHKYFKSLRELNAVGCHEYQLLSDFQKEKPSCKVTYEVDLGGKAVDPAVTELTLQVGEYDYDTLMTNLVYLPELAELNLKLPELSLEQINGLKGAFEDIAVHCTVEILGQEYDTETTELDLSAMTSADLQTITEKLGMLPGLKTVELMDAEGKSQLAKEEVRTLMSTAPGVVFNYTFDFFGQTLSTATEEVSLKNVKIGDEKEPEVRLALDLLTNCKRFVLDNCRMTNEVMAKIREDYRDRTKVVWRIWFGTSGSCLTDVDIFRCVGNLEKNYNAVKYCEDVLYMDVGHCVYLKDIEFVASMPKLRGLIVSGSSITSLEPLKECKDLEFLELSFCGYIDDLSPLKECTKLRYLNISDTKVTDLSPVDNMPLMYLNARRDGFTKSNVPDDEQARFIARHPNCSVNFNRADANGYYVYCRYEEDNHTLTPFYQMLRMCFRYDLDPNDPKQTGMYVSDIDNYLNNTLKGRVQLGKWQSSFSVYEEAVAQAYRAFDQLPKSSAGNPSGDSTTPTETTEATEPTA